MSHILKKSSVKDLVCLIKIGIVTTGQERERRGAKDARHREGQVEKI